MTTSTKRITLTMNTDAVDMLQKLAGSDRKMGAYAEKLIRAAHDGKIPQGSELETTRLQMVGLSVELNNVKARLAQLEAERA